MNLKSRIKMRQMPGDIGRLAKIDLLAGHNHRGKSLRKLIQMRERAVLKRLAIKEIELAQT